MKFWRQFGKDLKEGAGSDYENKERLLLLFESSRNPQEKTAWKE